MRPSGNHLKGHPPEIKNLSVRAVRLNKEPSPEANHCNKPKPTHSCYAIDNTTLDLQHYCN